MVGLRGVACDGGHPQPTADAGPRSRRDAGHAIDVRAHAEGRGVVFWRAHGLLGSEANHIVLGDYATQPIVPRPGARPDHVPRPKGRVWQASEIAQIRVVAPAIDGPNVCLVIRFEHEGEEPFAHWIGGEGWRVQKALERLFAEGEGRGHGRRPCSTGDSAALVRGG